MNSDLNRSQLVEECDKAFADVLGADLTVPLVRGGETRYVNLDHAASTPPLRAVADHLALITPHYSSIHRGAGYASLVSTSMYEAARDSVARFLCARPDDKVVFTRNTTDSLNLLSRCVPGEVLVLDVEHHANLLPWQAGSHHVLLAADTLAETLAELNRTLAERGSALLAITGASNVTGEVVPLERIVEIAHRHGTRVVVDAAQLAPHRRIDVTRSDVDYVAFSGHKTYAPYGAGVLLGRPDWLDEAPPHLAGGGAVREVRLDGALWAAAPERHEAGSPNVLGVAALAKACDVVGELLGDASAEHEARLRERLVNGLERLDGVSTHRFWADCTDVIGVVTFSVAGYDAGLVAAYLSAEHGIGVRDGRFCAHPAITRLGLPRSGAVRASFGLGSRLDDADRLVAAVEQLLIEGPGWGYAQLNGRWTPAPDLRPMPEWLPVGTNAVPRLCS
ncbi:putative aminotransferase/cysteine desulfurase [Lentzea sp. NBRC 105346]|uniref:aminotransferase class V-fold PLP-dependent enzyme n=1 Tax=Lentzea sp. NBRC 105346 TaxID=3032205 RepID=UPI0024A4A969|nr:aminotransferase class V-fold PLP-dependent enzyme [Lentzea sp. NBRC 105346]GLZ29300.1 putative aminotransferase/cysteine desulfurase [Lentzea sp. NBRC 105346]